jgi:NDP-sugar pyrophosphorylase family protein
MEFSSLEIYDILSDNNVISDSIGKKLIRSLTEKEKRNLDLGGNTHHPDNKWADTLYFLFDTPELPPGFIKNCYFSGKLFISYEKSRISSGSISNKDRNPFGLYNSNFSGICIVDFTSRLWNVSFISNMIVDSYSSITNCSNITNNTSNNESSSGIFSIHVGAESNPRILKLNKYNTYNSVCKDAINYSNKSNDKENLINQSESNIVSKKLGKVGENSEINDCPFIKNCFIGNNFKASFSILENCAIGDSCIVYSTKVKNVIMHNNSVIDSALLVDSAVLFDATSISEGARVNHSIIGPDASVAGGECHHSIVGPMAGFHHTSLLIAAIWPLGRGNLAYGSMIGANHTGRIADQECFPGEGCFFGLASALKFPQNLIESPYSIIVSGTICPAQKVTFPFSLISKNENNTIPSVLPSLNLIKPGWVFQENSYMVERNVSKFTGRRKSKEYSTDFDLFRPSIIEMVFNSREKLNSVNNCLSEFYSNKQINGLGQNVLLEKDRVRGISAYSDIIKLYALRVYYKNKK